MSLLFDESTIKQCEKIVVDAENSWAAATRNVKYYRSIRVAFYSEDVVELTELCRILRKEVRDTEAVLYPFTAVADKQAYRHATDRERAAITVSLRERHHSMSEVIVSVRTADPVDGSSEANPVEQSDSGESDELPESGYLSRESVLKVYALLVHAMRTCWHKTTSVERMTIYVTLPTMRKQRPVHIRTKILVSEPPALITERPDEVFDWLEKRVFKRGTEIRGLFKRFQRARQLYEAAAAERLMLHRVMPARGRQLFVTDQEFDYAQNATNVLYDRLHRLNNALVRYRDSLLSWKLLYDSYYPQSAAEPGANIEELMWAVANDVRRGVTDLDQEEEAEQ